MGSTSAAVDGDSLYSPAMFTVDEFDVAGVLLNLPNLIKKSKSFLHCPSLWSVKRKRSAIDVPNSDSPEPAQKLPPVTGKLDVPSTSPTSSMAFPSPINSDSKPLPPKNKAELLKECGRLTDLRDQLQRDIKKVEACRNELMAENKILRERRKQVEQGSVVVLPFAQSQPLVNLQWQPLMVLEYGQALDLEYRYRMAWVAMAENKAAAALARRNRSLIQKAKNSNRLPRGRGR